MADAKDPLRAARSDVLDAFARFERAVNEALLKQGKPSSANNSLGQKLVQLRQNVGQPESTKEFLAQVEMLVAIRNDIVHSEMRFHTFPGGLSAIYTNTSGSVIVPASRIMNLETHDSLAAAVNTAAKRIAA